MAEDVEFRVVDQAQLESSIAKKANAAILAKDAELDEKRLQKSAAQLESTRAKIRTLQNRLDNPRTKISQRRALRDEIRWFEENELQPLLRDVGDIQERLKSTKAEIVGEPQAMAGESEKDFLIRTGKITAFGSAAGFSGAGARSHVNLRAPGFQSEKEDQATGKAKKEGEPAIPVAAGPTEVEDDDDDDDVREIKTEEQEQSPIEVESDYVASEPDEQAVESEAEAALAAASESDSEPTLESDPETGPSPKRRKTADADADANRNIDDGDEAVYQQRLRRWTAARAALREKHREGAADGPSESPSTPGSGTLAGAGSTASSGSTPEWAKPHPTIPDAVLNDQFRLPGDVFPALFDYQKTCVQWLWELYSQKTGGIVGDEMGLGKTIQIIAFLAGLHYSGHLDKPVLLVVPATVLNQWVNEFHRWWPPLRCVILHSIGSGMGRGGSSEGVSEEQLEAQLEDEIPGQNPISKRVAQNQANAKEIVDRVMQHGHVLVTTYVGLRVYSKYILPRKWGYAVLDEGHKIRNPNSEISLACKRIKTAHRVILSGTPIQNNLVELWSLFDFVFPGRLGTLPVFEQQFAVPINMGGYANASNVQVQTGYQCAVILRNLISPYLLRRLKVDVAQDLPKKNEMVLFVKLTQPQQEMYERFLGSEDLNAIMKGKRNVLMGVDTLRKICNHPDLVDREVLSRRKGYQYGHPSKSGKLQVVKNLLQLWQAHGHRTLLFCQTKQMLDILERFVANLSQVDANGDENNTHFEYLRMDGSTAIGKRQQLVDTFNENLAYHVFLLTTKVGGLGVNLTGADRVIIFDPDWNPSTDIQARERAWRLGQKKDITIYRLMTAGTIEEKIYHRQIFKTFLTNKILKDPKQRRFFKLNDLHDLFTLGDPDERGTETGDLFDGHEQTFGGDKVRKPVSLSRPKHDNDDDLYQVARIQGVSKVDDFMGEEAKNDDKSDENRIMEGLFSNAGVVHSTLQHDQVVDGSRQEMSLVEREASKIARDAAEALKKSRLMARKTAIGTPTWTGRFGAAGRFGTKSKAAAGAPKDPSPHALSSSAILGELRQDRSKSKSAEPLFGRKKKEKGHDKEALLQHLVDYLLAQPGRFGSSDAILKALPSTVDVNDEKEVVMVRSLLRAAAEWVPAEKGWRLKAGFDAGAP